MAAQKSNSNVKGSILSTAKLWAKSKRKLFVSRYERLIYGFGPEDLLSKLKTLGITTNDTLFAHVAFDAFRGFQGKATDVIETLQTAIGPGGTLMMPTMSFTGTAVEFATTNPIVKLNRLPSRMGLVTELFRRSPDVIRSPHPTHPIAVWGRDNAAIVQDHYQAKTPCGDPSPLHRLIERDAKIILLGADFAVLTFHHTVEAMLESTLPVQPFTDEIFELDVEDTHGQLWHCSTRLYHPAVSRRRNLAAVRNELINRRVYGSAKVGGLSMELMRARDVVQVCEDLIRRGVSLYG